MKSVRRIAAAGIVLAMMLYSGIAGAQALKQVPSDALVVIKVKNLQGVSAKIGKLAQDLGLAQMDPNFADPLAAMKNESDISKGLKEDGEMIIAFFDPVAYGIEDKDKAILALLPIEDYQAFLSNFQDSKTEGAITQITIREEEDRGYVANWGGYAAMSPSKDILAKMPQGLVTQGLAAKELESKDIVLYANIPALRAKILPKLKEERQNIIDRVERDMAGGEENAKNLLAIKGLVGLGLDAAERMLQDMQSATLGINFADEGIVLTSQADFMPESYLGKMFKEVKNTDASLLSRLPQGQYLLYGGLINDPQITTKLIEDLSAPILKELQATGMDTQVVTNYLDALKKTFMATNSQSFGMVAPTGMIGQESLLQIVAVTRGDAKAIAASQQEKITAEQEMKRVLYGQEDPLKVTFTPNAKTVDGVTLDQFQIQVDLNDPSPQGQQMAQTMTMLYGPNGVTGYGGVVDDKHHITVLGTDALLTNAIAAAKGEDDAFGKTQNMKTVAAQLPQNRIAAVYIPLDVVISTGVKYAQQFGMAIPLQLPPNLPPIGATLATEQSAVRVDGYIPTQLIQSLVAAFMQLQMGGGGAAPGGPGGL